MYGKDVLSMINVEIKDFFAAQERLRPILHHTELDLSSTFSGMTGGQIYLKIRKG